MVILRVLDDPVADFPLIAEECLVIVVRRQVTVNHLRMIAHSYLEAGQKRISYIKFREIHLLLNQ